MSSLKKLDPSQAETAKRAIREMVESKYRVQAEKDLQKEIANKMKTEFGILPADWNSASNAAYDGSASKKYAKLIGQLEFMQELGICDLADIEENYSYEE